MSTQKLLNKRESEEFHDASDEIIKPEEAKALKAYRKSFNTQAKTKIQLTFKNI